MPLRALAGASAQKHGKLPADAAANSWKAASRPGSSWDQSARSPARARRILASSQHQQRIRHKKQRARLAERASEQRKWRCVGAGSRLHSARTQERARSGIACFALFVHVKCCNVVGALEGHNPKSPPQSSLYNTHVRYRLYQADS